MKFFLLVVVICCIVIILRSVIRLVRYMQKAHYASLLSAHRQQTEFLDRAGREKWMLLFTFLIGLWCTIKLFG